MNAKNNNSSKTACQKKRIKHLKNLDENKVKALRATVLIQTPPAGSRNQLQQLPGTPAHGAKGGHSGIGRSGGLSDGRIGLGSSARCMQK